MTRLRTPLSHRAKVEAAKRGNDMYADLAGKPRMDYGDLLPERKARTQRAEAAGRPLEADVIRAVEALLAVHPRVLWALRMNSGAASYEAASGKFAPVYFHRWVRGAGYRMADFMGAFGSRRPDNGSYILAGMLAIECKRPDWTKPTDQREREQDNFLQIVRNHGGIALFATSAEQVAEALR